MVAQATTSPNFASPEGEGFPPSPEETLMARVDLLGGRFSTNWLAGPSSLA